MNRKTFTQALAKRFPQYGFGNTKTLFSDFTAHKTEICADLFLEQSTDDFDFENDLVLAIRTVINMCMSSQSDMYAFLDKSRCPRCGSRYKLFREGRLWSAACPNGCYGTGYYATSKEALEAFDEFED